jgi:pyroglutamyl-peptidase
MTSRIDPAAAARRLPGSLSRGCVLAGFSLAFLLAAHEARAGEKVGGNDAGKPPVILLTGFEPFGKYRTPNPSWEGIKKLDGQEWKGYRLVCKQMPVVWGAPLEHLQGWITEYQPVAVFSFGQGGPGCFAFESKASKWREKKYKDNQGERPSTAAIVEDGPERFDATISCARFAELLRTRGHHARVSTSAGRYLCEEALYTLEYLKSSRRLKATVLFCHVPSLDSFIPGNQVKPVYAPRLAAAHVLFGGLPPVDAYLPCRRMKVEDVQRFVKDTLETWHTLYQDKTPAVPRARTSQGEGGETREHKEIKEFIGRYFRTWSNQDMKGYEACFLPEASIQHISAAGRLTTSSRPQFIASQRNYHRTSPVRTTEVAESVDIRLEGKLARVVVFWKLTAGARMEWGYDHFTLIRQDGGWRIVNLVFYETPPPGKTKKPER